MAEKNVLMEYTSINTTILNVKQIKEMLLTLK
ncbi:MAG: hypothetical protein LBQ68_06295 [Clostridiales bacterium]|nr:hypothetical protein [Clostridiales bacterium]